jgi:sporulation protein YlmC with PRC-barrel domain
MFVISNKEVKDHLTLSSLVGKKVIAKNGEVLGKVSEVAFDLGKVIGIYYHSRTGPVLLGMETIDNYDGTSVMLHINPVVAFIGRAVYDKDGKRLGRVREVFRSNTHNDVIELVVRRGVFRSDLRVPKEDIEVAGKNILLNRSF